VIEAIAGGLVGALVALLGTLLIVRDSRRARELATEERAAAALLAQLRHVRHDPLILDDERAAIDFTEECMTAVLAFRDREVRKRLTASVGIIAAAPKTARTTGTEFHASLPQGIAFRDVWRCLERRLDRRKLPKPSAEWTSARDNLHAFLWKAEEEFDAAERAHDEEREDFNYRMSNP
jgi:hypothetical protein